MKGLWRGVARLESLRCLQWGGKVSGPEVISANMGSFDCVRLAPHFAQDDSGSYNGGSYRCVSYNSGPYNGVSYNGSLMDSRAVVVFASSHGDAALGVAPGRGIVGR